MKRDLITLSCIMLVAFVIWAERDRWMPTQLVTATPAPRHLSPQGTFFMVQYVSVHTQHGVAGFEPGLEVHLVDVNKDKGTLRVTDGKYQTDVGPMQITNDLDVAAVARRQDQESQRQLQAMLDSARQTYERSTVQANMDEAKELAQVRSGSVIGAGNLELDQKATPTSTYVRPYGSYYSSYYGSPYYYLAR